MIKELLIILVSSSLISNVVLSQFLGLCPFLGVSKKTNTAAGMGTAVIFVITLSSAVTGLIYQYILTPLDLTYLQTIVFILVIAALVQFVEMFLKKFMKSLCRTWYCINECAEELWDPSGRCEWFCNCCGIYDCHRDSSRYP